MKGTILTLKQLTMKTIKEWLSELPEPYRGQALANYDPLFAGVSRQVPDLSTAISSAFEWNKTTEGIDYWSMAFTVSEKIIEPSPPINALSAIHAIALKEGFPVENIISIRPADFGEWAYQLKDRMDKTEIHINLKT